MALARLEYEGEGTDEVNSSDWLYCMSIQLRPEAVLTAPIGTGPWK